MNSLIYSRCKVALAIGVAAVLYAEAAKTKTSEGKYARMRMAADAIDRTYPEPDIVMAFRTKPAAEPDALFLLRHMDKLHPMPKAEWPTYKIKPREWGIYTRILRGLELFVGSSEVPVVTKGSACADLVAMLKFASPLMQDFPVELRDALMAYAVSLGVDLTPSTEINPPDDDRNTAHR
jgi:hypothetical protein